MVGECDGGAAVRDGDGDRAGFGGSQRDETLRGTSVVKQGRFPAQFIRSKVSAQYTATLLRLNIPNATSTDISVLSG